jgi:hypothetical protein
MQVNAAASIPTIKVTKAAVPAANNMAMVRRIATGTDGGSGAVLSGHQLMTDVKVGVAVSVPMQVVMDSQAYRKHETTASQYTASVISQSLGFGTWTLGGAAAAALLAPLGLGAWPLAVAGFAAGMIANTLWDRTFGKAMMKVISERLPESAAKHFADPATKYFANPIYDHIWLPIKHTVLKHKVLGGVLLAGLALRFPMAAKGVAREATVWIAGTLGAMGVTMGLINHVLPDTKTAPTGKAAAGANALDLEAVYRQALEAETKKGKSAADAETAATEKLSSKLVAAGATADAAKSAIEDAKAMIILEDAYSTAIKKFTDAGANPAQADAGAQKWLVDSLCKNGAKLSDAQTMVKAAAESIKKSAAPAAPAAPALAAPAKKAA